MLREKRRDVRIRREVAAVVHQRRIEPHHAAKAGRVAVEDLVELPARLLGVLIEIGRRGLSLVGNRCLCLRLGGGADEGGGEPNRGESRAKPCACHRSSHGYYAARVEGLTRWRVL